MYSRTHTMEQEISPDLTGLSLSPLPTNSHAVGNHELLKTELRKMKLLLEAAYENVAILDNELDINKESLSRTEDSMDALSSVYFSNRFQSVGFNTITPLMSSMHQVQSAIRHRYPEQKHRLAQNISYGPAASVLSVPSSPRNNIQVTEVAVLEKNCDQGLGDSDTLNTVQVADGNAATLVGNESVTVGTELTTGPPVDILRKDVHTQTSETIPDVCETSPEEESNLLIRSNLTNLPNALNNLSLPSVETDNVNQSQGPGVSTLEVRDIVELDPTNEVIVDEIPIEVNENSVQLTTNESVTNSPTEINVNEGHIKRRRGRPKKIQRMICPSEDMSGVNQDNSNVSNESVPLCSGNGMAANEGNQTSTSTLSVPTLDTLETSQLLTSPKIPETCSGSGFILAAADLAKIRKCQKLTKHSTVTVRKLSPTVWKFLLRDKRVFVTEIDKLFSVKSYKLRFSNAEDSTTECLDHDVTCCSDVEVNVEHESLESPSPQTAQTEDISVNDEPKDSESPQGADIPVETDINVHHESIDTQSPLAAHMPVETYISMDCESEESQSPQVVQIPVETEASMDSESEESLPSQVAQIRVETEASMDSESEKSLPSQVAQIPVETEASMDSESEESLPSQVAQIPVEIEASMDSESEESQSLQVAQIRVETEASMDSESEESLPSQVAQIPVETEASMDSESEESLPSQVAQIPVETEASMDSESEESQSLQVAQIRVETEASMDSESEKSLPSQVAQIPVETEASMDSESEESLPSQVAQIPVEIEASMDSESEESLPSQVAQIPVETEASMDSKSEESLPSQVAQIPVEIEASMDSESEGSLPSQTAQIFDQTEVMDQESNDGEPPQAARRLITNVSEFQRPESDVESDEIYKPTPDDVLDAMIGKLTRFNKRPKQPVIRKPAPPKRHVPVVRKYISVKQQKEDHLNYWCNLADDDFEFPESDTESGTESPEPSISLRVDHIKPVAAVYNTWATPTPFLESDLTDLEEVESDVDAENLMKKRCMTKDKKKSDEEILPSPIEPASNFEKKRQKAFTPNVRLLDSDSDTTDDEDKKTHSKKPKNAAQVTISKISVDESPKPNDEEIQGDSRNPIIILSEEPTEKNSTSGDSSDECVILHSTIKEGYVVPPNNTLKCVIAKQAGHDIGLQNLPPNLPAFITQHFVDKPNPPPQKPHRKSRRPESVCFLGEVPSSSTTKGRRDIRPIKEELTVETQQAERNELDRRRALEESQKLQEQVASVAKPRGLVLEFDLQTKVPIISVEKCLSDELKPHQESGVRFMWDSCFGSVSAPVNSGCVLAHLMGLGKSFQALTFLHTVLTSPDLNVRTAIVVSPLGILANWQRESERWLGKTVTKVPVYTLSSASGVDQKKLNEWNFSGGIALMHYDALVKSLGVRKNQRKGKSLGEYQEHTGTVDPVDDAAEQQKKMEKILLKCDILICDEGHLLKNPNTGFNRAVKKFPTQRRIILTGTPLQNNLKEYYHMVNLIKPNLLGNFKEFANGYINPISNGLHTDSSDDDVKLMKRRVYVLNEKLHGCVQRMDFGTLKGYLKPQHEYALYVKLSDLQNDLYEEYMKICRDRQSLMTDYNILQRLCLHPKLLYTKERVSKRRAKPGSVDKGHRRDEDEDEDEENDGDEDEENEEDENELDDASVGPKWFDSIIPPDRRSMISDDWTLSGKLVLLKEIITACGENGDKLLVFSRFSYTLDIIEEFIHQIGVWELGKTYFRIDGNIKPGLRDKLCSDFNFSSCAKLFLLTQKAGGLGFNLHGANRVVLFDVSFNPSDDTQSIFRAYRLGQQKEVYIYRLVAYGGMEETTYKRSIVKLSLARRVVDEQQVVRSFVTQDSRFYRFTRSDHSQQNDGQEFPIPGNNDELLKNLLVKHRQWIHDFVEHSSLLTSGLELELNDAEKTFAKTEQVSKPVVEKKPAKQRVGKQVKKNANAKAAPVPGVPRPLSIFEKTGQELSDYLFKTIQEGDSKLRPLQICAKVILLKDHLNRLNELIRLPLDSDRDTRLRNDSEMAEIYGAIDNVVGCDTADKILDKHTVLSSQNETQAHHSNSSPPSNSTATLEQELSQAHRFNSNFGGSQAQHSNSNPPSKATLKRKRGASNARARGRFPDPPVLTSFTFTPIMMPSSSQPAGVQKVNRRRRRSLDAGNSRPAS